METTVREGNKGDFKLKIGKIQRRLVMILASMVLLFITAQFIILSVVGVKGDTLSQIKTGQEDQRIQNEILRARILDAKVSSRIRAEMEENLNMNVKSVKVIDAETGQVTALK